MRRRLSSGSPYESAVGFSRAVVANGIVHVAGTAPVMDGGAEPPADAYGQARRCLEIVLEALAGVGASAADVVRTRIFLTSADDWQEVGRAHREVFAETRPASTMVVVKALLDPRWRVEIEADAMLDSANGEASPLPTGR